MRQVYSRPFTVQVIRSLATSSQLQKRKELSPESDVILLTGQDKSQTSIKYSELLERVGKKNLVKVTKSKVKVDLPMFQLMTDVELEIAMRKEKAHSASYAGVRTSYGNFYFCVQLHGFPDFTYRYFEVSPYPRKLSLSSLMLFR